MSTRIFFRFNCYRWDYLRKENNSRLNKVRSASTETGSNVHRVVNGEAVPDALWDKHTRFHNYLRISLTERCNLRCQYCMPEEGVSLTPNKNLLNIEELLHLTRVFSSLGVDKVRLTGGEPTLRRDLPNIIEGMKAINGIRTVCITTNGLVLTRTLPTLMRAGLDSLNISLDTLRANRYEQMSRRAGLSRVLAAIDLALQLGYTPLKVNCVLMKGFNDDEICDFVEWTRDRQTQVRFIEFMPFTGNSWDDSRLVPYRSALSKVFARWPELQPCTSSPNDTAKVWQVPGYAGSIGFITSMTDHFCSSCNRIRLTADGNLKVCLFGDHEVSLRDALRSGATDEELTDLISRAIKNKKPKHAVSRALFAVSRRCFTTEAGGASLSHVGADGRARMVDVGDKRVTLRKAVATCEVRVGPQVARLLSEAKLAKGDALTVAEVAGVAGAKRTHLLVPLCHPLQLDCVRVSARLDTVGCRVRIECEVRTTGRTGAEMEALTGASVAALTIYDMCKSANKHITIERLRVVEKSGGKRDFALRDQDTTQITPTETYAPINFPHL